MISAKDAYSFRHSHETDPFHSLIRWIREVPRIGITSDARALNEYLRGHAVPTPVDLRYIPNRMCRWKYTSVDLDIRGQSQQPWLAPPKLALYMQRWEGVPMTNKRVFISFDNDNDKGIRGNLVAQTNRLDSLFSMKDESVYGRID